MIRLFCFLFSCCVVWGVSGQDKKKKKTSTLFTVGGKAISSDEFIYLFEKNHSAQTADHAEEEIENYLDLFIRFKLKVEEARARGMDTTQEFRVEYTAYRDELLKPYLPNTRLTDSLVQLTYDRLKEDVRASHILISVKKDAPPADTLEAYQKALEILRRINEGEKFEELAATFSDDPSARTNGGDLGYFTALQMVYPFETIAYSTDVDQIGGPVRSAFGYHLVKVTGKRPSRGEVDVSHIMLRSGSGRSDGENRDLIFEIYDQLKAGASWDELCAEFSQDQSSRESGGRLRPFGVRAMVSAPPFEEVAFSLWEPGEISDPFQSPFGWHIVKLNRKIPVPPLDEMREQLQGQVTKDERFENARELWMEKLKIQMGYQENPLTVKLLQDACEAGNCSALSDTTKSDALFQLAGQDYAVSDFLDYLTGKGGVHHAADWRKRVDTYVTAAVMDKLEKRISEQNSTFLMLSREYYEGILLFEIMDEEVWTKAAVDSAGQRKYYVEHSDKYRADERAEATFFASADSSFRSPLRKVLAGGDSAKIWAFVEKSKIAVESGIYEKNDRQILKGMPWATGTFELEDNGMYYLAWLKRILPAGERSFEEAKAAIVSDYQQELEDQWIDHLRKKYPVKVNEKARQYVFDQLRAE